MDENQLVIFKKIIREYPAGTKFRSLFGATDYVSETEEIRIDKDGDAYIIGVRGEFRLIHSKGCYADIYKEN
jgi:hypothetical protein